MTTTATKPKLDFIGIGAQKAATSWIDACLREHPEICMSRREDGTPIKELFFFDRYYKKGLDWYAAYFNHCGPEKVTGEITPDYLFYENVPACIHTHFPEVKIVVCFRNPVERAYSQYRYDLAMWGGETFREALEQNPQIVERGYYARQLKRYLQYFNREQMHVIFYEDIERDPASVLQDIYAFLGVGASFFPQSAKTRRNKSDDIAFRVPLIEKARQAVRRFAVKTPPVKRVLKRLNFRKLEKGLQRMNTERIVSDEAPEMDAQTRAYLERLYAPDIRELEKLVSRDLSHWYRGANHYA